jgi:hypothetical protein
MPRSVIWITLALLCGLVLGAWGPRSDLAAARNRIRELEARLKEPRAGAGRLRSVTDMLRIPAGDERDKTAGEAAGDPDMEVAEAKAGDSSSALSGDRNGPTNAPSPQDLRKRIDEAAELWRVRSDVARNSFVSNAGLDRGQTANFDVLMAAMNIRLATSISNWVGRVSEKEQLTAEDGARIINELSSHFVLTYDELDRKLQPGWREGAGESFDLITFVDPSVASPLIGIEDRLGRARGRRP